MAESARPAPFTGLASAARRIAAVAGGGPRRTRLRVTSRAAAAPAFNTVSGSTTGPRTATCDRARRRRGRRRRHVADVRAGLRVDFVEDLTGSYFRVKNPNATSSCGCGTSFAI